MSKSIFEIIDHPFSGVHLVQSNVQRDERGVFVKIYHEKAWRSTGLPVINVAEEFWSSSNCGVLRGMHFQLPPDDYAKVVTCTAGRVLDVLLDLRKDSASYGLTWSCELSASNGRMIFIPSGIAHGFLSLQNASVMLYKTSAIYSPSRDAGIKWDSFGFIWPITLPILSERDRKHPAFSEFTSPF